MESLMKEIIGLHFDLQNVKLERHMLYSKENIEYGRWERLTPDKRDVDSELRVRQVALTDLTRELENVVHKIAVYRNS